MAIVFFDIDRTLINANTALDIVKYYLKKRLFGPRQVIWLVVYQVLYRLDLANPLHMMLKGLAPFVGRVRQKCGSSYDRSSNNRLKRGFIRTPWTQ